MTTRRIISAIAAGTLGIVIVLNVATDVPISPPSGDEGAQLVDRWLEAMAGTGADRGWQYLSAEAQAEAYGGDESGYLAEVGAVDWQAVRWGPTEGRTTDYGFVFAYVPVLSDPRSVPHFVLERRLMAAVCSDRAAINLFANVPSAWFQASHLATVGRAGSEGRCEDLFYADTGPIRPPADLVGWAWATGGNASIRVEVIDETDLVEEASGGRDKPPLTGADVTVADVLGQVAIAWVGNDCSDPVQIVVHGNADAVALELQLVERPDLECAGRSRTYEVLLRFSGGVSAEEVAAERLPIPSRPPPSLPTLPEDVQGCAGVGLDAFLRGDPMDPRVTWLVDLNGARMEIVWPRGYAARFDPDLAVLDERGMVVYRAGDRIEGGCVIGDPDALLIMPP